MNQNVFLVEVYLELQVLINQNSQKISEPAVSFK